MAHNYLLSEYGITNVGYLSSLIEYISNKSGLKIQDIAWGINSRNSWYENKDPFSYSRAGGGSK